MQIYRGHLELLDYVFYATVERGKVYETGAFIHNYALAYALRLARDVPYSHPLQEPLYLEELSGLNEIVYLTPAAPQQVSYRLVQWNTIREGYAFPGKPPSLGYPDWGFARMLRPGSTFVFYTMVAEPSGLAVAPFFQILLAGGVAHIRLGKFLGKVRVRLEQATTVKQKEGEFMVRTLINWRDLPIAPLVCDVLANSLPTRLLNNAHFSSGPYYEAHFREDIIFLPAGMGFLTRLPPIRKSDRRSK